MQTSINADENALAGGMEISLPKSAPLRGFKFGEYVRNDYCLSCTYFQSVKGHFGFCTDFGPKKLYDGAKQGSACTGWRKKGAWADFDFKLQEEPFRKRTNFTVKGAFDSRTWLGKNGLGSSITRYEERLIHSSLNPSIEAKVQRFIQRSRPRPSGRQFATLENFSLNVIESRPRDDFCHRCNGRLIKRGSSRGEPLIGCKKCGTRFIKNHVGYPPRFRFSIFIIEKAIRLSAEGFSMREVSKELHDSEGIDVSHVTVMWWVKKFQPNLNLAERKQNRIPTEMQREHAREARIEYLEREGLVR